MKFTLATALSLFGAASAVATPAPPATFQLLALRSSSPIHFSKVSASLNSLFLNLPHQDSVCKGPAQDSATFYIENEELFFYSTCGPSERQRVFTDRSGMGQGKIGWVTGDSATGPRYGEFKGWRIDAKDGLMFKNSYLLACPTTGRPEWSIWISQGINEPAGLKGCLGFTTRKLDITKPVSCKYT